MNKTLNKKQRELYNQAVYDTLKELWLFDGLIPNEIDRQQLCLTIQYKVSYKNQYTK